MSTTDLYEHIVDTLADHGYAPCEHGEYDDHPTVRHYAERGYDAVRYDDDGGFTFARWSHDGCRIIVTTASGALASDAAFDVGPRGVAMFLAAATVEA